MNTMSTISMWIKIICGFGLLTIGILIMTQVLEPINDRLLSFFVCLLLIESIVSKHEKKKEEEV
jgi:hypothetical protein